MRPNLEGRRHSALGDVWCHCRRMDQRIDIADEVVPSTLGEQRLVHSVDEPARFVGIALQDLDAL